MYTIFSKNDMITNQNITIIVENNLYERNKKFFDNVLSVFEKNTDLIYDCLFIYSSSLSYNLFTSHFYCNPDIDWRFQCLSCIEEYVIDKIDVTTFHGGGVIYNNKLFLLIGDRFNGKSTLIHYLSNECGCDFVDDDNIFYRDGKFWGYNMPIRLRNKPIFQNNIILNFLDERNNTRYLIKANRRMTFLPQSTIIVFPKYIEGEDMVNQIVKQELFQTLLKSVRHSRDNYGMFKDLIQITKSVPAYYIKYDYCDIVFNHMKAISI